MSRAAIRAITAVVVVIAPLSACSLGSSRSSAGSEKVFVVAAEDFWGSIARQLGGDRVEVDSLIANPSTDPHDYEPTPRDARAMATAQLVVVNGIGYDPWADKLLSANHVSGQAVVRVGRLVGLKEGDNPHQWYSPDTVEKVITAITDALKKIDPSHGVDYDRQRDGFESSALAPYHSVISAIKGAYAGTPVGVSESIFTPMAAALDLHIVTPPSFLNAISEGNEPTAADKATVDRQITAGLVKVFVYNRQNATPDVRRLVDEAKAHGIQVSTVTETLTPQGSTFQAWQTAQLQQLQTALAAATAR